MVNENTDKLAPKRKLRNILSSFLITFVFVIVLFVTAGDIYWLWAMYKNRFFSGVVRIQEERGHHVIDTGPYRFIRHPVYLGSVIYLLALPIVLTSYWALIPAVLTVIIALICIFMEENTLKRDLTGYGNYMQQVRFRLVPDIW